MLKNRAEKNKKENTEVCAAGGRPVDIPNKAAELLFFTLKVKPRKVVHSKASTTTIQKDVSCLF